jgi:membrane associated rhomboid family serine protease
MLFIPLGDDVNKRYVPAIGMILIAFNSMIYLYEMRLWSETLKMVPQSWTRHHQPNRSEVEAWYARTPHGEFINKFGVRTDNIEQGHVMCVFTYMWLHADIFHIIGNMFVLWALVGTLENTMGQTRFMFCYLAWGIAGGIAHAVMNWGSDLPMIGASGAIAGMIGAYFIAFGAVTKIKMFVWILFKGFKVDVPAGFLAFLWVLSQLAGMADEEKYGEASVAWYCHAGGFVAGMLTMLVIKREVVGKLTRDKISGELSVVAEEGEKKTRTMVNNVTQEMPAEVAVPQGPKIPTECPNCKEPVSEENKIYDRMLRCPNPSCNKLIMYQ